MSLLAAARTAESAQPEPSPFLPGGPLAPWSGQLPSPRTPQPPQPPDDVPPAYRLQPALGPSIVEQDSAPNPAADRADATNVSAFINPALFKLGKVTGHVELAPYGPHALFLEVSRLSLDIQDRGYSVQAKGWEYDVGYHLFPLARGARGFYIGPRYVRGSGQAQGASGDFSGWGGDLGYQWVFANHLVFNLGAGAMYVSGSASLDPSAIDDTYLPPSGSSGFESLSSESGSYLLPLLTAGLGLAI